MGRFVAIIIVLVLAIAGIASAAPETEANQQKLKIGFVYLGPIGDHGWTYQHDQGRLQIEETFGTQVETIYIENIGEGPDAERAISRLALQGAKLIFTTSFGFMDPTIKAAENFPEVMFEHATGYKRTKNVSTYSGRFYEGRYVIGQIAAQMSETGVAGYIASFPIPEVVRGINSFLLGAQTINPEFKLKIVWVNSWFDPGKEADAAKVLFGQGVDIIAQHTDSTAPLQVAAEFGGLGFGQASDMILFAPDSQLTAVMNDWGPYYIARTAAVLDGSWESQDSWNGIGPGMVRMASYTNMPPEVAMLAKETEKKIALGELHPFQGPIYRQDGTMVIGNDETLDDVTLLTMNWYIQGIDDRILN